jgi:hypothetical protein
MQPISLIDLSQGNWIGVDALHARDTLPYTVGADGSNPESMGVKCT